MAELSSQIHALLFSEGGALTYKSLAQSLGVSEADIKMHANVLAEKLQNTGLTLVLSDTEASLAIVPEAREAVVRVVKDDEERAVGEAGLEIVAILLYEGPSTRAHIDYIRGVNSSSTLRTLISRGLIERSGNPEDGREFVYRVTSELLAHCGLATREDAPEYGTIAPELTAFKAGMNHAESGNQSESGME